MQVKAVAMITMNHAVTEELKDATKEGPVVKRGGEINAPGDQGLTATHARNLIHLHQNLIHHQPHLHQIQILHHQTAVVATGRAVVTRRLLLEGQFTTPVIQV